jgi:hypothetical protein
MGRATQQLGIQMNQELGHKRWHPSCAPAAERGPPQIRATPCGGGSADCVCSAEHFTGEERRPLGGARQDPAQKVQRHSQVLTGTEIWSPACGVRLGQPHFEAHSLLTTWSTLGPGYGVLDGSTGETEEARLLCKELCQ